MGHRAIANGIQDVFESPVFLPKNLDQFVTLEPGIAPYVGVEKPEALIVLAHVCDLVRLARWHRGQLVGVTKHNDLGAAEGHFALAPSHTHGAANGIHGVCVDHRNLIDYQEVDCGQNLAGIAAHLFAKVDIVKQVKVKAKQ